MLCLYVLPIPTQISFDTSTKMEAFMRNNGVFWKVKFDNGDTKIIKTDFCKQTKQSRDLEQN